MITPTSQHMLIRKRPCRHALSVTKNISFGQTFKICGLYSIRVFDDVCIENVKLIRYSSSHDIKLPCSSDKRYGNRFSSPRQPRNQGGSTFHVIFEKIFSI